MLPAISSPRVALLAAALLATPASIPTPAASPAVTVVTGTLVSDAGQPLAEGRVLVARTTNASLTDARGRFRLSIPRNAAEEQVVLKAYRIGYEPRDVSLILRGDSTDVRIVLKASQLRLEEVVTTGAAVAGAPGNAAPMMSAKAAEQRGDARSLTRPNAMALVYPAPPLMVAGGIAARDRNVRRPGWRTAPPDSGNTESYDRLEDNPFRSPSVAPLSTFSVDVDRASYGNVRRYLVQQHQLPPRDAVRVEELVNYFPYDDPAPGRGEEPLRISTEVAAAPWNAQHDLVRIALRARDVDMRRAPASNLVFLIDVSGSMFGPGRLPLVKDALRLLVNQLREEDRVAIVVYAGNAGLVLPSTSGADKERILGALDRLEAGGSTAGGAGIRLAYDVARDNFIRGGTNRVILCTDGDFNVGASSDGELVRLIEDRRKEGSFLTILGFGMGNYKDSKMEKLAGAGNGNYGYVDDLLEARKLLVHEMGGTLITVAKDVKLQVEFNPEQVQAYRLLGYEDRLLRDEDFANDAKDAGDVGAGHTVTALYEVVRTNVRLDVKLPRVAPLRYQRTQGRHDGGSEMLNVAMRWKEPDGERSRLMTIPVRASRSAPSESMRFASAVAGFGMLLRGSPYTSALTWGQVESLARGAIGRDAEGYRAGFVQLVQTAASLSRGGIAAREERDW